MFTLLLIIIYVAFIGLGLPHSLFGAAWPAIQLDFGVSIDAANYVTVLISGATVVSSMLGARLTKKFGTSRVVCASTILAALSLLGFSFAGKVKNLKVITNSKNIKTKFADEGRIEFWPKNYKNTNEAKIPGANNNVFDFGDTPVAGGNYGSMQIHNPALKETIFAFNGFVKKDHDLGLGNQKKGHPDWTFAGNSNTYSKAILKVYAE